MADRILFRFWTIMDYEEEEQFLREQHQNGWRFKRYLLPGFYFFDRCTPEDVVYRLDFDQAGTGEKLGYLQLYRDYGWEYLFDVNSFSYFRKPADIIEDDLEIFSDNESRLEMIGRIYRRRMIPLMIIFLCCVVPQLIIQSNNWLDRGDAGARAFTLIFLVFFMLYVWLFVHCGRKIRRLRQKYERDV